MRSYQYNISYNSSANYFVIMRYIDEGLYTDKDGKEIQRYGSKILLDTRSKEIIDRIKKAREDGEIIITSLFTKDIDFNVDNDEDAVHSVFYFIFQKPEALGIA